VPETFEQLREIVQGGLGSPRPVSAVRESHLRRRRRRMIPRATLAAASVLVVSTVAVVHARDAGRLVVPVHGRPTTHIQVDTSLTPPGWVAVDWADVQLSVPGSWLLDSELCNYGPGSVVALNPVGSTEGGCLGPHDVPSSAAVSRSTANESSYSHPEEINGIRVFKQPDTFLTYFVPALRADIFLSGPDAHRVIGTLTHSPRQAVLEDSPPGNTRPSWKTLSFQGLTLRVPPSDTVRSPISENPVEPCSFTWSLGSTAAGDTDSFNDLVVSCDHVGPRQARVGFNGAPGVVVNAKVAQAASAGGFGPLLACIHINGLDACPYADPAFDILGVKVSGVGLPHALLVEIGLSGDGEDALQILHSMRAS
jgi:hypothetical protein